MSAEGGDWGGAGREGSQATKRLTGRLDNPDDMQALLQYFADQISGLNRLVRDLQYGTIFLSSALISERASMPRPDALSSLRNLEEVAARFMDDGWTGPVAGALREVIDEQIAEFEGRQKPKLMVVPRDDRASRGDG